MQEIWKPIPDHNGLYEVSTLGRVRNTKTGRIMRHSLMKKKVCFNGSTYHILSLRKSEENKRHTYYVHRLVAQAFIPNPNNYPQVNHINEDKGDNRVENLEWCDNKYNNTYGTVVNRIKNNAYIKSVSKPVQCIETGVVYSSIAEACRQEGIKYNNLREHLNGKNKTCHKYHWCYYYNT